MLILDRGSSTTNPCLRLHDQEQNCAVVDILSTATRYYHLPQLHSFPPDVNSTTTIIASSFTSGQDMSNSARCHPTAPLKKRSTPFFSLFPSCFPAAGPITRSNPSKPTQTSPPIISRRTSSFSWLPPKSKLMSVIVGSSGGGVEGAAFFGADQEATGLGMCPQ